MGYTYTNLVSLALIAGTLADAAALAKFMETNYSTIQFDASDVWRVQFSAGQFIKHCTSKWRSIWILDVYCSQHL